MNQIDSRSRLSAQERSRPRKRWPLALLYVLAMVISTILWQHYGDRFVFTYAETYTSFSLWSVVLLSPFVLYRLRRSRLADAFAKKYPTRWVRHAIVLPMTAVTLVGLHLAAPLGWLFAAVAWSDIPVERVHARAIEVGAYARRKGCDQHATLRLASADKKLCLDGLFRPSAMRRGQGLELGVKATSFGLLIVSVSDQGAEPAR